MKRKKKSRGNLLYLLKEAWRSKRILYLYFVLNIVFTLILSAAAILTPRYLIAELTGEARVKAVITIAAVFFVATAAAGTISAVVKAGYEMDISRFRYSFISRMKEKIMRVRYEKLEDPKYLNEFWRVTSATSDIEFGVQGILTQLFVLSANGVSAVFYLSVLGKLNFLIVLLLIADIYIVYLLASKYEVEISRKASPFGRRQRYLTNVMGNLAYGKDLRIYGLSNILLEKLMLNHKSRRKIDVDIQKHHYGADLAESILSCVRDIIIYSYLICSVLEGRISIADFTMCFMAAATLTVTLEKVFEDMAFVKGDLFRIDEMRTFLDLPNEDEGGPKETVPVPQADHYEITFRHVSFHYPGTDENVYTDFSFTIKAGKKLAIVGINGAGDRVIIRPS